MGLQSTNIANAINVIKRMISLRQEGKCKIVLAYTSNLISCGLRETFNFLVKNKLVDTIVTTTGGIEEDFIKCMGTCYMGSFQVDDRAWRKKGLNRIGNMIAPNNNYCNFEDFILPLLDGMLKEQTENNKRYSPS